MKPIFRPATKKDVPFVVECIKQAEAAGTDIISYQRLFNLSNQELDELLNNCAQEDILGTELSYINYLLAEDEGQIIAGCASWPEAYEGNLSSNMIKAQTIAHFIGIERWKEAKPKIELLQSIEIPRTPNCLQLESFYVIPEFRGKALTLLLIEAHLEKWQSKAPSIDIAQIILMDSNTNAQNAYQKAGFKIIQRTQSDNPLISELVPGTGKCLMERQF